MKILIGLLLTLVSALFYPTFGLAGSYGTGVRTDYSSTNVGTSNWKVIISQTSGTITQIAVADTSGQVMEVGVCPSGATTNAEVRQFLIPPGGISVSIQVPLNYRISIRAVSASATSGENDLNVLY